MRRTTFCLYSISLRSLRIAVALKRRVWSLSAGKGMRLENLFISEGRFYVWLLLGCRSRHGVGGLIVQFHNTTSFLVSALIQSRLRCLHGAATITAGCCAKLIAESGEVDLRGSRHRAIQYVIDDNAARPSGGWQRRNQAYPRIDPNNRSVGCAAAHGRVPCRSQC